jgi:glucose-6-phosphate-specific signal transduction histidine kinase
MKPLKSLDFIIQIILLAIIALAFIIDDFEKLNPFIFIIAFGIVQIISIIVHLASGPQKWKKTTWRKFHLAGTAIVLVAILVAFIQDSSRFNNYEDSMPGLGILLYATIPAILLALFYTVITGIEWMKVKKED